MGVAEMMEHVNNGLACLAAIFIIFSEITSSIATKRMLVGATSGSTDINIYNSPLVASFLMTLLVNASAIHATIDTLDNNQSTVLYLDGDPTNVSLNAMCSQPSTADFLYDPTVLLPLLGHILAPTPSLLRVESLVLVDCFFDGRILPDTTTLKVHVLDPALTTLTTLVVQTLTIARPHMRRESVGGLATFTTTPLASCYLDRFAFKRTKPAVKCAPATYNMTVGFEFPYEAKNFVLVNMSLTPTLSGVWPAHVVSTGEDIVLMGTEGIYRSAPDVQGSYDWYSWQLPPDPVAFMTDIKYVTIYHIKDSWGFFRCFLGLGIAFHLLVIGLVSLVVMVNLYRHNRVFWLPDLYPTIQRRASLRVVLLVADCLFNRWWYPFQFALNEANQRDGYGGTTFLFEMVRADGLMICLAITQVLAATLGVRVQLHVTIVVFLVCFECRIQLVDCFAVYGDATSSYLLASNEAQIFTDTSVPDAMSVWAWVHTPETSYVLLVHEYTWLAVAIGANVAYVVLEKLVRVTRPMWRQLLGIVGPTRNVVGPSQSFSVVFGRHPIESRRHWSVRSTLYYPCTRLDSDGTCFERSVGTIVSHVVGFVTPSVNYVVASADGRGRHKADALVSRSGVWLLGYVVMADRVVVAVHDVPLVAVNALFKHRPPFRVYGFLLERNNAPVLPKPRLHDMTSPSDLLSLTLDALS
ncbi:Aste57867_14364 [Aphanomyces stellatus]|uniref:Aste57867_14364 protein n=1 Tax=Aphanomyces stellatus TaxID=120398 RepID=A0A485L2X0_9STRA|nr:hypothetical protein As57867_014310 [Aphanomyces stellatus]VFT91187.1 Aste57867_14364 [Aphanomyces stellatus]